MQSATTQFHLSNAPQAVAFSESEGICSAELFSSAVVISTDAGNHCTSKVKLKNVVDYNWEPRYYTGQLLAVHMGGKYLAYAIKVPNNPNPGTWSGMVRVIYKTTDQRVLLKGMKGEIQDLSFAHIENRVILASIDEHGHTYVHSIELVDDVLRSSLVVEIVNDAKPTSGRHRVVWCPFIPDEDDTPADKSKDSTIDDEDDDSQLLLTTHYNTARIWKMWGIVGGLEAGVHTVSTKSVMESENPNMATVSEHSAAIVDAAFSPDSTALATASVDGYVLFFQIYLQDEMTPRCLYRWPPHDGKPLSCLFFLDNHKNSGAQFWKFAVTGAERNSVIKIWCCKSWSCMQTLTFAPDILPELNAEPSGFKAVIDSGAQCLVLSDFRRRCLYVLHMEQVEDVAAYCRSISEFLLPFPVLSFAIADAGTRTIKCSSSCGDPYHVNGGSGENGESPATYGHVDDEEELEAGRVNGEGDGELDECGLKVHLKLYLMQPKALQEGRLLYTPPPPLRPPLFSDLGDLAISAEVASADQLESLSANFLQQQSQQLKNILMRARTGSLMEQLADSPPCAPAAPPQLNLMTPDAFSSPGKREEEDPPIAVTPDNADDARVPALAHAESSPTAYELDELPPKYTSVGSSPSREVQEILSIKESDFFKDELVEASGSPEHADDVDPLQNGTGDYDQDHDLYIDTMQTNIGSSKHTIWPQITIAQINEANQRKASSDKSASQSINNSIVNVGDLSNVDMSINEDNGSDENQLARRAEQLSLSSQDRSRLDAIELKLEKITDMMTEQNRLLRSIRDEHAESDPRAAIEEALNAHTAQTTLAIDTAFDDRWGRVEMAAAGAGAAAADAVSAAMARVLEPLTRSLQVEFATRMSATDTLLRDNIEKLVHSKSIQESLGNAVARTLSGMVRDSFREVIAQTLVPTMEKATGQIFKQINHAFQNGTKEFASNTEAYARAAAERGGAAAVESLRAALQRHADALTSVATQQPPAVQQLTPVLHSAVRGVLEQEMSRWREQAASVLEMSRSQTPVTPRPPHTPHQIVDRQMQVAQISSLLNAGDMNGAFQLALSASDLSLVVHACRTAEPARVFTHPCQLKQHVLMSLVQQLAADMSSDTQLKLRYLEEAIIKLEPSNPVTREHMPIVMKELKKQLTGFLAQNPGHQLTRQINMLLMATESLLHSGGT